METAIISDKSKAVNLVLFIAIFLSFFVYSTKIWTYILLITLYNYFNQMSRGIQMLLCNSINMLYIKKKICYTNIKIMLV